MRVLVINPGATSTKVAVFEDWKEVFKKTIDHDAAEIAKYNRVSEQLDMRRAVLLEQMREAGYAPESFDAVCGRGGTLRKLASGTYAVNEAMLDDARTARHGEHASLLGPLLAHEIAALAGKPAFVVDPVSVDEMQDVARVSGFKGMERQCGFHALNHKSVARKAAAQLGKPYEELNLVVVHMGGGSSVAAHKHGRVVDVNNVRHEGAFSMDRGGTLPVGKVVELCFSGKTKAEINKLLGSASGVYSYLGTKDFRTVEERAAAGDAEHKLIFDAFIYQHGKDIGAMAAVLDFNVDAIVLTGGIAHSKAVCDGLRRMVGKIAPIIVLPGEEEMLALAEGAFRVLCGQAEASKY